jgi:hypothetical protein
VKQRYLLNAESEVIYYDKHIPNKNNVSYRTLIYVSKLPPYKTWYIQLQFYTSQHHHMEKTIHTLHYSKVDVYFLRKPAWTHTEIFQSSLTWHVSVFSWSFFPLSLSSLSSSPTLCTLALLEIYLILSKGIILVSNLAHWR